MVQKPKGLKLKGDKFLKSECRFDIEKQIEMIGSIPSNGKKKMCKNVLCENDRGAQI